MISGSISYGRYEVLDSLIIIKDDLYFGQSKMKDTLILTDKGIKFKLEEKWRIEEGIMSFDYY